MSAFAGWGLAVLGIAIIATIAEMLLPRGKMKSAIRYVVATVASLVIVTPIPSLLSRGVNFDFSFDSDTVVDAEYIEYVDGIKKRLIETAAVDYLEERGISGVEISVEIDENFEVKSARMDFSKTVITGNDEHINKSEIIRLVADFLRIGEEAIMTYG